MTGQVGENSVHDPDISRISLEENGNGPTPSAVLFSSAFDYYLLKWCFP